MKKVTFILSLNEAIKIDYALELAFEEFLERGQKGYAREMEAIRQHLSKQTKAKKPSKTNNNMMHDAINGRR